MEIAQAVFELWNVRLPADAEIVYYDTDSGWSWGCVLLVWKTGEKYFAQDSLDDWRPYEVTEDDALQMMVDFDEHSCCD